MQSEGGELPKFNVLRKLLASMAIDQALYSEFMRDPRGVMVRNDMPANEINDVLDAIREQDTESLARAIGAEGNVTCALIDK